MYGYGRKEGISSSTFIPTPCSQIEQGRRLTDHHNCPARIQQPPSKAPSAQPSLRPKQQHLHLVSHANFVLRACHTLLDTYDELCDAVVGRAPELADPMDLAERMSREREEVARLVGVGRRVAVDVVERVVTAEVEDGGMDGWKGGAIWSL